MAQGLRGQIEKYTTQEKGAHDLIDRNCLSGITYRLGPNGDKTVSRRCFGSDTGCAIL